MRAVEIASETHIKEILAAIRKVEDHKDNYYIVNLFPGAKKSSSINKRYIRRCLFEETSRVVLHRGRDGEIDGLFIVEKSKLSKLNTYSLVLMMQPIAARPIACNLPKSVVSALGVKKLRCSAGTTLPGLEKYCGFHLEAEASFPSICLYHYALFLK